MKLKKMLRFSETPPPDGVHVSVFSDQKKEKIIGECFLFANFLILVNSGKQVISFQRYFWSMS